MAQHETSPHESTSIASLVEELRQFHSDFRVFKTKLMGDDELEDEQGRLPRIEDTVKRHGQRITSLEKFKWGGVGISAFLGGVVSCAAFVYYIHGIMHGITGR
jgi:hypothetical protein